MSTDLERMLTFSFEAVQGLLIRGLLREVCEELEIQRDPEDITTAHHLIVDNSELGGPYLARVGVSEQKDVLEVATIIVLAYDIHKEQMKNEEEARGDDQGGSSRKPNDVAEKASA